MNQRRVQRLAWLASLLVLILINAAAAKPANPGFEVKFFLDPNKTLDLIDPRARPR
jgi:hypothetical protein